MTWGRLSTNNDTVTSEENGHRLGGFRVEAALQAKRRRGFFSRVAPIAFLLREDIDNFVQPIAVFADEVEGLSASARDVARYLRQHGAVFLADIARGTGLLKTKAEEALWELVARGLVTGDGIAGLRVLLTPELKRLGRRSRMRLVPGGRSQERMMPVGRWSLWRHQISPSDRVEAGAASEFVARQLLRRYGVVLRELLARETRAPSWRALLQIYRRLEARGEIRGGRFISGFVGEQYALPQAVEMLRAVRRTARNGETIIVSSADPLNLVGILTPGSRISPYSNLAIAYENGIPVEIGPLGAVRSRLQREELSR